MSEIYTVHNGEELLVSTTIVDYSLHGSLYGEQFKVDVESGVYNVFDPALPVIDHVRIFYRCTPGSLIYINPNNPGEFVSGTELDPELVKTLTPVFYMDSSRNPVLPNAPKVKNKELLTIDLKDSADVWERVQTALFFSREVVLVLTAEPDSILELSKTILIPSNSSLTIGCSAQLKINPNGYFYSLGGNLFLLADTEITILDCEQPLFLYTVQFKAFSFTLGFGTEGTIKLNRPLISIDNNGYLPDVTIKNSAVEPLESKCDYPLFYTGFETSDNKLGYLLKNTVVNADIKILERI